MTVSRMTILCWTVFAVMCGAWLPIAAGIDATHVLPGPYLPIGAIVLVIALWWGPFAYGVYLTVAVVRNGDRRLLERGVRGTGVVLSATRTNRYVRAGARVYRYRLEVRVPGWEPYETKCAICATGFGERSRVSVAVAPHNRKRVTIDVDGDEFGARLSGAGDRR